MFCLEIKNTQMMTLDELDLILTFHDRHHIILNHKLTLKFLPATPAFTYSRVLKCCTPNHLGKESVRVGLHCLTRCLPARWVGGSVSGWWCGCVRSRTHPSYKHPLGPPLPSLFLFFFLPSSQFFFLCNSESEKCPATTITPC